MGCAEDKAPQRITGEKYVISPYDEESKANLKWATYLYNHLKKRGGEEAPVFNDVDVFGAKRIVFRLDDKSAHDFSIEHKNGATYLTANDTRNAVWLIHQFMRFVADADDRFAKDDLPASIISFNDTVGDFSFRYRDIYAPLSMDEDMRGVLGLHSVDANWGLWGHNLARTIQDKSDKSIYATINGMSDSEQFCFSSEKLYKGVEQYIVSNYGKDRDASLNFAIFPNDNNLVCMCNACTMAGNTKTNATPAVTKMIERLAARFPHHNFFTSAYMTTKTVCQDKLPDNVGVIVSAIDWLPGRKTDDKKNEIERLIDGWSAKSNKIYVWDYINNFDDYFTPYPILKAIQDRLKFYKQKGVSGVFLNGSGYDFSTFMNMETCVMSQLMMDPQQDVKKLLTDFFVRTYPVAGTVLAEYYCCLLDNSEERDCEMPYYGGISEKLAAYLDEAETERFYKTIDRLKKDADEEEAFRLRRLITAHAFALLEIARHRGYREYGFADLQDNTLKCKEHIAELLEVFEDGYKAYGMEDINEAGDKSADYVESWKKYLLSSKKKSILFGKNVRIQWPEGNQTTEALTDGEFGLPVNYYYGWNIYPYKEMSVAVSELKNLGNKRISMNFFSYLRHRIQIPSRVEIYAGDVLLESEDIAIPPKDGPFQIKWEKDVQTKTNDELTIRLYASGNYHMAVDEICITE